MSQAHAHGPAGHDQHGHPGGGFGLHARPVGAYVIKDGAVSWVPAIDVTRVVSVLGIVTISYLLTRARTQRQRVKTLSHPRGG
jgi:hypothetical protein